MLVMNIFFGSRVEKSQLHLQPMKLNRKSSSLVMLALGLLASLALSSCAVYPVGYAEACYVAPTPRPCHPSWHGGGYYRGHGEGYHGHGSGCDY